MILRDYVIEFFVLVDFGCLFRFFQFAWVVAIRLTNEHVSNLNNCIIIIIRMNGGGGGGSGSSSSSSSSSSSRMVIVCKLLKAEINLLYMCVGLFVCVCVYVNTINTSQRTQNDPINNTSR